MDQENQTSIPTTPTVQSISTTVCAVLLTFYALYFARSLIVPIVTALFAYLTLRPIVRQLRKFRIPPVISAAGIMSALVALFLVSTYLVVEPAQQVIAEAPHNIQIIKERLANITSKVKAFNDATEEFAESADEVATNPVDEPIEVEVKQPAWTTNLTIVSGTGSALSFLSICGVMLYFLLATGDDVIRNIMRALPSLTARKQMVGMIEDVQEGLGSYLAQVTLINAGLGLCVGTAMWLLGMPTPILWGVMATMFNFIPIVGAMCGAMIILLVALVTFDSAYYAFAVVATFLALTSIEGQFVTPSILGRSMEISPVLVFVSICLWGWIWGLVGVFLSVPILIAIRMASLKYDRLTPMATVLGGRVHQVDEEQHQTPPEPAGPAIGQESPANS